MTAAASAATASRELPAVPARRVLGVDLAALDYEGAMDAMDAMVERRAPGYVCAVATHAVMVAQEDPEMMSALQGSTLTVPDGMPLVWAMNALGEQLRDRVYGPDLMLRYTDRCARRGHRVFLYGGRDDEALAALTDGLRRRFDGLAVVGGYSPPFRDLTG